MAYTIVVTLLGWTGTAWCQAVEPGIVLAWGSDDYGQAGPPPETSTGIVMVAAGWEHSVALTAGGGVLAWGGWNGSGECTVPPEAQTGIVAVAAGGDHTVALTGAGRVLAWGWNAYNQCVVPPEAETGIVAIAAGMNHTLALTGAGRVLAWGRNDREQCEVPPEAQSGIKAIAAGDEHSMALTESGKSLAWGYNDYGQCDIPAEAQANIKAVSAGGLHSMALDTKGCVWAWGNNSWGQTAVPTEAQSNVTAISARNGSSMALTAEGRALGWGWNVQPPPVSVTQTGVTVLAAGKGYALAISSIPNTMPAEPVPLAPADGLFNVNLQPTLYASVYEDADGDTHTQTQWQVHTSLNFSVVCNNGYGYNAKRPAETNYAIPASVLATNRLYYWRVRYQDARLGWSPWSKIFSFSTQAGSSPPLKPNIVSPVDGTRGIGLTSWFTATPFSDPDPGDTWDRSHWQISTSATFSVVWFDGNMGATNRLRCPAENLTRDCLYYLRVRYRDSRSTWSAWSDPLAFYTRHVVRILQPATEEATWSGTAAAITVSGVATSRFGLADATLVNNRDGIVRACAGTEAWSCPSVPLKSGMNILTVTVRDLSGVAVTDTLAAYRGVPGGVTVWGTNDTGQMNVPADARQGVVAVAAGRTHVVALKGGRLLAWGDNSRGQCLLPNESQKGVCAVAAGYSHTLILRGGMVHAWGSGLTHVSTVPAEAETDVDAIAAGQYHSLALKKGRVLAWGENTDGQCNVPAAASNGVTAIAAGRFHSAAVTTGGMVVAWGDNLAGQCAVPPESSNGVVAVAAFNSGTAALKANGAVVAWGNFWPYGALPLPAVFSNGVVSIVAGGMQKHGLLALKANGKVIGWGNIGNPPAPASTGSVAVACGGEVGAALVPVVNAPPRKPVPKSPADGAAVATRTPTLKASAFSDPNAGDTFRASRWQVAGPAGFAAPEWDSGVTGAVRQIRVPAGALRYNVTYRWRVRYQDAQGAWGAWSAVRSFTTRFPGFSVNCGGPSVQDWSADTGCALGTCITSATAVANATAAPAAVYRTARIGTRLVYRFPDMPNGVHRVTLHFSEPLFNAAGKRLFRVRINGVLKLNAFDIRALAGARNRALTRSFDIQIQGGDGLTVEAVGMNGTKALVCGIAVLPAGLAGASASIGRVSASRPLSAVAGDKRSIRTPEAWAGGAEGSAVPAPQVLDGDPDTAWRGASDEAPWRLTLDLGRCEPLLDVEVVFGDPAWSDWAAAGSADELTWFDLIAATNRPVWCRYLILSFPPSGNGAESPVIREIRWHTETE